MSVSRGGIRLRLQYSAPWRALRHTPDPELRRKLLVGSLVILASLIFSVVLVGLLGWCIVLGYSLRLLDRVRAGAAPPLPRWDQWGRDLGAGLRLLGAFFLWNLPFAVLSLWLGQLDNVLTVGLGLAHGLLQWILAPAVVLAGSRRRRFRDMLEVQVILTWAYTHFGPCLRLQLVTLGVVWLLGLVAAIGGLLLLGIGWLITVPLALLLTTLYQVHLYGQLAVVYGLPGTPE